jgi:hypothetical protein
MKLRVANQTYSASTNVFSVFHLRGDIPVYHISNFRSASYCRGFRFCTVVSKAGLVGSL